MFKDTKKKYNIVNSMVKLIDDRDLTEISKFLGERIASPDNYVVMLGETSSGKTTLINGLLGKNLLYTSVKSSTGTIIELSFTNKENVEKYFAINKNATMERLTENDFLCLSKKADDQLSRLRVEVQPKIAVNGFLRLFDTPGYGSLIENHEEILIDFLPESNIIIYVVSYKVGIQQEDINFLNFANEIISDGTEFILVINRIPENIDINDKRIDEITGYVSDFLHYSPKVITVPNEICGEEYPLPLCLELWNYIENIINSEANLEKLKRSFDGYIIGLFEKCETIIRKRKIDLEVSAEDKEVMKGIIKDLQNTFIEIKENLIEPTFNNIIESIPPRFETAKNEIENIIFQKIDNSSKMSEDEMRVYITSHMLQFETKKQVDEIKFYIDTTLKELDRQVDDKLNRAISRIEKTIELKFNVALANMTKGIFKKSGGKILEQSLLNYFKKFAGNGGTGIANASKHLLKKFGDLFGKTFSRETHNRLASLLSKIGATSAKAVGMGITVVIDIVFTVTELLTWQKKLKKVVHAGIEKWHENVVEITVNDLLELKNENIRLIDEEIELWISDFDITDNDIEKNTIEDIENLISVLESVRERIQLKGESEYE